MYDSKFEPLKLMIVKVAEALGSELLKRTAFVGGITTGLLITDEYTKQQVRATDDVDLITATLGYVQLAEFEEQIRRCGFRDDSDSDIICRKLLGNIKVDFMPADGSLGFSNRWYKNALEAATDYALTSEITIRLLTPVYFIGTKLEAWNGRGEGDLLSSRDIEDIFNLINGRETLVEDMRGNDPDLLNYIANELKKLTHDENFDYLLQSTTNGNADRMHYLFNKIEEIIRLADE